MSNPVAIERTIHFTPRNEDGTPGSGPSIPAYREVRVWCQGCQQMHPFRVEVFDEYRKVPRSDGSEWPTWTWNGSLDKPTFGPSLLVYSAIHLCEGEHEILSLRCDREFEECGHNGHGYGWILPDGTVRQYKVYEYDQIPEGTVQFTWGGESPHPREPAWGNCHTFLVDGVWDYLGDCAHSLRGHHPLEPIPDRCLPHGY